MTTLLQQAFEKASQLPVALQDEFAKEFIDEIEWEMKWDQTLSESQNTLEQLTLKAMKDYEQGKTKEMGFDEL